LSRGLSSLPRWENATPFPADFMTSALDGTNTVPRFAELSILRFVETFVLLRNGFAMNLKRLLHLAPLITFVLVSWPARAQSSAKSGALFDTVRALDTQLFDAYNHCDLKTLGAMVSDDLEFYHDQTGLSVGKGPFVAAIQQNICGKVERTLVPGSMEVYPLKGYGAVEIGLHRFHHPAHQKDGVGEAKFVMLWQNKNGAWTLTRVISYNHESVTK
jgi:hypothetical protein